MDILEFGLAISILSILVAGIFIILFLDVLFEGFQKLINKLSCRLHGKKVFSELKPKSLKEYVLVALNLVMALFLALFSLATATNATLANSDFMIKEVEALDVKAIAGAAKELLSRNASAQQRGINVALDSTMQELEPWVKEQTCSFVQQSYDYFLGRQQDLDISISLEPLHQCLRKNLGNSLSQNPEFKDASPDVINSTVDYICLRAFGGIPEEIVLSTTSSNPETINTLNRIATLLLWYRIGYWLLVVLILLMVYFIVRLSSDFQVAMQTIGMNMFSGGALGFIYSFVLIEIVKVSTSNIQLSALQNWLVTVMSTTISRTKAPGVTILICGLIIFALSFAVPYFWRLKKDKSENLCQPSTSEAQ